MANDPQEGVPPDRWVSHDDIIWIGSMPDEYLLNSYKTCVRHNNPKQADLLKHIKRRKMEWRVPTHKTQSQQPRNSAGSDRP